MIDIPPDRPAPGHFPPDCPDLTRLEDALNHTLNLVCLERHARTNWANEDKAEWSRRRVNAVRALMLALSEYL